MNQETANKRQGKSAKPPNVKPKPSAVSPSKGNPNPPVQLQPTERKNAGSSGGQNIKGASGQVADKTGGSRKLVPNHPKQIKTIPSTNRPGPVGNDGGETLMAVKPGKPQKEQKTTKDDSIIGRETQITTDGESVKPVLKKKREDEPSAKSGKKLRNKEKEKARMKSVTFLSEPDAASAMVPIQTVPIKPATKTGFKELSAKDFFVIFGFWFIRFFIPWVEAWHNFNFYLLREPSYWDPLEKDKRTQEIILFCVMSVVTVSVSVFADFFNFQFLIFLILLLLFTFCPVTGAILNGVLVARAYNQDFYRKWAFTSDTLFHWALAIAFVSFPIQLSCVFSQNDYMSRQAHYNWTAVLVFLESINRYIAFWVIPGKCPTRTFTQSAIWFLIGVVIFAVLLFNANFSLEWAKPEMMHSNRFLQESMKYEEQNNVEVMNNKRRKKFIWFLSILAFLIITSFVFATLRRLTPGEDWDKHNILSATSMFLLGEILGAVFMVAALLLVRWKLQYYHHLPFLRPDVLALGLPHMINFLALVALLGRFATLSNLKEGDVIIGPIPEKDKMAIEFYNFDYRNRTVCVHSTSFRPLKIGPRQRGTREIYDLGSSRIHFTVTLDPQTTPALIAVDSFEYQGDTWATFIITLPFSNIKYSDVQALYSKPEIVRVEGTQRLRPKKKPQVFFMNTFVINKASKAMWMFLVKQRDSSFVHEFRYMLRWETVIIDVPNGHLEIVYHLVNSTLPPQTVKTTINKAEDYSVWSVLLGHSRPMKMEETYPPRMLKAFNTMETAGPHSGRFPSKAQLQRDVAIMAGMTLAGMASSGIFIGMIYLFWLDTPFVTFRTTCIGVFWVLLETPAELSKIKVVDIGLTVISVLAFLQIVCTVLHFIAATQLYTPKFNLRKRPD